MTQHNKFFAGFIVIAIYCAVLLSVIVFNGSNDLPVTASGKVQAVFLSDGQVYFGSLKNYNDSFAQLSNVYYLKYGNSLQQGSGATSEVTTAQNLNLVKLGGEVHGPESSMFIAKDKILFIENLKDLSNVVQAIKKSSL